MHGDADEKVRPAALGERGSSRTDVRVIADLRLIPSALDLPIKWRDGRLVFVNSMSDLFHEDVPTEFIERVFQVMAEAAQHPFQVLTKRADRLLEFAGSRKVPSNVWLGVSVESAANHWRIDCLRQVDGRAQASTSA